MPALSEMIAGGVPTGLINATLNGGTTIINNVQSGNNWDSGLSDSMNSGFAFGFVPGAFGFNNSLVASMAWNGFSTFGQSIYQQGSNGDNLNWNQIINQTLFSTFVAAPAAYSLGSSYIPFPQDSYQWGISQTATKVWGYYLNNYGKNVFGQ